MERKIVKEYTNGEITVVWKPDECIHAAICFRNLPNVFKPNERPWVKINAESTDKIIKTVEDCPTDALTWRYNNIEINNNSAMDENKNKDLKIQITENGPIHVPAGINVIDASGKILKVGEDKYLCRCGHSKNKPFCDGAHKASEFKG
jgi:uncharacterized Fe-S cluster protein YjdI